MIDCNAVQHKNVFCQINLKIRLRHLQKFKFTSMYGTNRTVKAETQKELEC